MPLWINPQANLLSQWDGKIWGMSMDLDPRTKSTTEQCNLADQETLKQGSNKSHEHMPHVRPYMESPLSSALILPFC